MHARSCAFPACSIFYACQQQRPSHSAAYPTQKPGCRLEGFKDPWDCAVHAGRALALDRTLREQGITSGAAVITVRRKLVPEGLPFSLQACSNSMHAALVPPAASGSHHIAVIDEAWQCLLHGKAACAEPACHTRPGACACP